MPRRKRLSGCRCGQRGHEEPTEQGDAGAERPEDDAQARWDRRLSQLV